MHEFEGMRIPGIGFRDVESEMGRLRAEILSSRREGNGEEGDEGGDGNENRGERGEGEGKEGKKYQPEMEFTFWGLTGQYWAKGQ